MSYFVGHPNRPRSHLWPVRATNGVSICVGSVGVCVNSPIEQAYEFASVGHFQIPAAFSDRATLYEGAQLLVERCPELRDKLTSKRRPWEGPNARMLEFSAIALAITASFSGQVHITAPVGVIEDEAVRGR